MGGVQKSVLERDKLLRFSQMDKRHTVFVSSTYTDMIDERNAVIQAVMRAGHIPLGMEAFGAANASSWKVITKTIDAADYYVLLIARRYGSVNQAVDMGYTEQEFQYAVEQGVPVLVFLLEDTASWPGHYTDTDAEAVARLKAFRTRASTDRQVAFWNSKADLPYLVMTALGNAFSDDPRPGWVRPSPVAGPGVAEEIARLSQENAELKRLASANTTFGGTEVEQLIRVLSSSNYGEIDICVIIDGKEVYFRTNLLTIFKVINSWLRDSSLGETGKFIDELLDIILIYGDNWAPKGKIKNDYYLLSDSLEKLENLDLMKFKKEGKSTFLLDEDAFLTPLGHKVLIECEVTGRSYHVEKIEEDLNLPF